MSLLSSVKGFLFGKSAVSTTIFPEITKYPPMPSVKQPIPPASEIRVDHSLEEKRTGEFYFGVVGNIKEKHKPELTEPVELIIKAMKERPETFDITSVWSYELRCLNYTVFDKVTNYKLNYTIIFCLGLISYEEKWLTQTDLKAIHAEVCKRLRAKKEAEKLVQDAIVEKQRLQVVALYKENT